MSYLDDPRVYFAAERTLLAWVRTGVTLMGFGFIIARFGIFLAVVAHGSGGPPPHAFGLGLGVALVLLGAAVCGMAGRQFRSFLSGLGEVERPVRYFTSAGPLIANGVAVIGIVLAGYLLC